MVDCGGSLAVARRLALESFVQEPGRICHGPSTRPITVALLGTPEVSAATLYGFYDMLASTRRDWQMLHGGMPAESPFRPLVVSVDGRPSRPATACTSPGRTVRRLSAAGRRLHHRPDDCARRTDPAYEAELAWLRGAWDAGATVASACSGALLLARTGLLDDCDATSHWAYCDRLAREHPRTRWHPNAAGAGGARCAHRHGRSGVAWHMLVLALIARFVSPTTRCRWRASTCST